LLSKYNCDPQTLINAVGRFKSRRVLVIGDLMLDRFVWGAVNRISPEAPVPVVEVRDESTCLGGAANVAMNIYSLGGMPVPLGVVGKDDEGNRLTEELAAIGTDVRGVIADDDRVTSVKTRIIAHHQQVCRTDREDKRALARHLEDRLVRRFKSRLPKAGALIISDYSKGLISKSLMKRILPPARAAEKIVCVDPKLKNLAFYRPATVITPNTLETEHASGITIGNTKDLLRAGRKVIGQTGIGNLLVTRGEQGMTLFEGRSRAIHIPTVAREVFDVTGAGDTVISTLALGLAAGLTMLEASVLANVAAGVVVGKLGTASVTPEELIARIRD
jgi:D-beta-D-heptose 7-phosphate kinase/D-beta-D-heptose 1-phosphate adenosyltransferase